MIVTAWALLLCACGAQPGDFPVPAQRPVSDGKDPGQLGHFLRMDDPMADEYIVKDVTNEKSPWRWTLAKPELKLRVPKTANLKFVMDFIVTGVTFKVTGPVVVTCYLNENRLGSMRCPAPGQYRFEKPVPPAWAPAGATVTVRPDVDKLWVAPDDGARLGFLLGAIGFPEEP